MGCSPSCSRSWAYEAGHATASQANRLRARRREPVRHTEGTRRDQPRRSSRRGPRHRRRLGVGQVGPAQNARRPAPAGQRRSSRRRQAGRCAWAGGKGIALRRPVPAGCPVLLALRGQERHAADAGVKLPAELSGGMVKRAAFARALALDPRILFLDEPTSDLDPLTAGGIDALIAQLNRSLGITVVVVTHDLTTLLTVCSRLAILVDKKITVGTVDKLMRSSQPWIHDFLHGPRAQGAMSARKHNHGNG